MGWHRARATTSTGDRDRWETGHEGTQQRTCAPDRCSPDRGRLHLPPSGRDAAAAGSASRQSIVDWNATYVPPSTIRPSTPTPPPLTDAPILTLRRLPNGPTCDDDPALLVPSLAVYADGRVIAPTGHAIGYLCDAVPAFRAGRTDVVTLRAAVKKYLSTEGANLDISKSENVADGGLTRLEYTAADGRLYWWPPGASSPPRVRGRSTAANNRWPSE